jgi:hypothetical protein
MASEGPPYLSLLRRVRSDEWVAVIYARRGSRLWLCARAFGSSGYVARVSALAFLLVADSFPKLEVVGSDGGRPLIARALAEEKPREPDGEDLRHRSR